MTKLRSRFVNL